MKNVVKCCFSMKNVVKCCFSMKNVVKCCSSMKSERNILVADVTSVLLSVFNQTRTIYRLDCDRIS